MLKKILIVLSAVFVLAACNSGTQNESASSGGEEAKSASNEGRAYKFSGGPSGGTFQYYASGVSQYAQNADVKVLASSSAGSIENIRTTDSGKSDFSIAYSGHVFMARNGMLKNDDTKYNDILAVSYLYGAPAQLVTRAADDIGSASDLAGKRVGVGNAGSGAAANAELFFTELGLWEDMSREFLGYREAAAAFKNKQLDAFWVFAGFPNASVLEAALQNDVNLINVYKDAEKAGMFEKYPYFTRVVIPANTYSGQTEDVITFQDSALWVANSGVPEDVVYDLVKAMFSPEGLEYMVSIHKSAKAMSVAQGTYGIVTPLHPGAEKFWKEMGTMK